MLRHLLPRISAGRWSADALTVDPDGGQELPPGFARSWRQNMGLPTTTPTHDKVLGGTIYIQWLGLVVEIAVGGVA